jgi:hypothetical protein
MISKAHLKCRGTCGYRGHAIGISVTILSQSLSILSA